MPAPLASLQWRRVACITVCLCILIGVLREYLFLRPGQQQRQAGRTRGMRMRPKAQPYHRPGMLGDEPWARGMLGGEPLARGMLDDEPRARGRRRRRSRHSNRSAFAGAEALPRANLTMRNLTTFALPNGQCLQRAVVLPSLSCSLPECNKTRHVGKLFVLTNSALREWVAYLRFELADLALRPGARLVDVELQLHGTGICHRRAAWGNFTHQLHVIRAQQTPSALALNKPYPKRLTAQWSRMQVADNFRIPLNLNGRQLVSIARQQRLNFVLSEKLFGLSHRHRSKTLEQTCSYYSSTSPKGFAMWPKLHISYTWRCCAPPASAHTQSADEPVAGAPSDPADPDGDGDGHGSSGDRGGSDGDAGAVRPPWMRRPDWSRLLARRRPISMPWHSRLATKVPKWVYAHRNDAVAKSCEPPRSLDEASGGQVGVPSGEPPAVSVIIAYHNNENMTAQCVEQLWACASELPSVEYLLVDDGSDNRTGELPATLSRLARQYGIRYELMRYPVSVGFTMATSEAARRANGTYLFFLNNDAFVRRHALTALIDTFSTHADIGVVGAKLVGTDDAVQEAGAIIWADASGAWFNKYMPLYRGRKNEMINHRLNYLRETDYVSAAAAMVPRRLFIDSGMFDMHFSPGYYEDTDLSFTMRAKGLRVVYNPFAHVVHMAHSTYQSSMDALLERNKQQFASKWRSKLLGHMPPCNKASACFSPNKAMYTHIAATRMYTYRVLWMDMVLPEPDRDSGSVRTLTMIKLLLAMRCHVSIVTVQRSGHGRHEQYTRMLQYLGVHVIPEFKMLKQFTVREPYDFIVVARRDTYAASRELLHRHYPNTLLVFDTVDLHFMRERARRQFLAEHADEPGVLADIFGGSSITTRLSNATEQERLRQLELDAYEASSVAIVVSEPERVALRHEARTDGREVPEVVVLANAHEPTPPTTTPYAQRNGLVFVGNFNHLPNRDAVLFFVREVLPRLLRVPMVRRDDGFVFHVAGANKIPPSILALNNSAPDGVVRVIVHGHVPELRPLYARMRVSVAPLRWGAGVKGKVNTAHQLGVPVVCTSIAVDGMHANHGEHVLIGDSPEQLAASVLEAYYNATLWRRLATHGAKLLETRFSASRAAVGLLSVLAHLRDANTLMGMKSLALGSARPRIYSDLRAAAALGGYYFNLTSLAPRLDFTDTALPDDYTCTADGVPTDGGRLGPDQGEQQVLQRIAASGF